VRWYSMSVGFLQDPKVEQLAERHGPAGPLVIVDLLSAAALAGGEKGDFERSFRTISISAHIDRQEAADIVDSAIDLGLVTEKSRFGHGVSLAFPEWKKWQQNGRQAKSRESRKNAEKPHEQADVTESHRPVTGMSPTDRQTDKTENSSNSARVAPVHQPILSKLSEVAFARNLVDPKVEAVVEVNAAFAQLDLEAEAAKFAAYWTTGPGAKRGLDDVAWRWRTWLEGAKDKPATGNARSTVADDLKRLEREHAAALAEEARA
jgi:hypothetical protein